jgi:2'-5' RNA ligase
MLYTHIDGWNKICKTIVDEKDVYDTKDNEYGYETEPHITLVYGIHDDDIDRSEMFEKIKELEPVTVEIEEIGVFEIDDYDVVKMNVPVTKQLKKYRKMFEDGFPNTQKFKTFKPHITLAYVKKGCGKKYGLKLEEPIEITFDRGVYSDWEHKKRYFDLE